MAQWRSLYSRTMDLLSRQQAGFYAKRNSRRTPMRPGWRASGHNLCRDFFFETLVPRQATKLQTVTMLVPRCTDQCQAKETTPNACKGCVPLGSLCKENSWVVAEVRQLWRFHSHVYQPATAKDCLACGSLANRRRALVTGTLTAEPSPSWKLLETVMCRLIQVPPSPWPLAAGR